MKFLALLQEVDINEKLNKAPDAAYGVGVFIGSMLPFVILVTLAYLIYRYNKNKKE
ncbi:hypothetical protein [Oceanihabitans sediminis]|uniref:hypothetical protein n=1 Tax=Oceanihabitans sediminis TaxID=1812012 RepID=UPI000A4A4B10|nr:hypothetical protein [Oceanihabitans sediminis]MDX1277324.1 hypothetical protein [Oceanihabitans sediminis]MDX1773066.1 hypothetical protein [Oceanihabitans sediminis]RBP34760.1 hypothetical protein DFR65_101659 [Oceanihabitans sediminis]